VAEHVLQGDQPEHRLSGVKVFLIFIILTLFIKAVFVAWRKEIFFKYNNLNK
jgi:hypothetical protein